MHRVEGFTLADLLVAVGVISLLLGIGVPTFTRTLLDARMTSGTNALVHAVHLAKRSAHSRLEDVVLCASPDGRQCSHDGRWHLGWLLFVNTDGDNPPRVGPNEPTLAASGMFDSGTISANRQFFVFRAATIRSTNGTFTLCDRRGPEYARAVVVSYTGRPRVAKRAPGGGPLICQM